MKALMTLTLLLLISGIGVAQEDKTQDESQQQAPAAVVVPQSGSPRGEVPPETPGEHGTPANSVQVGVNVSGSFDSLGNSDRSSGSTVGEGMVFRLNSQSRNRRTMFEYLPSYSYRTGSGQAHNFAHALNADSYFRLGERWNLHLQNGYRLTTDPFQASSFLPSPEAPNATLAIPYSKQTSEVANAELNWRATKRTSVGWVGNFAMQRYSETLGFNNAQQGLLDSTNSSGSMYVRYAFTKRFTAGLEAQYQDLLIGDSFSRTQSYSAVAYTSIQLTRHSQLTFYGGPLRSHLRNQILLDLGFFVVPINVVNWNTGATGGASYSLQMKHSRFYALYSNRITDGGGLMGAVTLNTASASFDHDFTRLWSGGLGFGFGNNAAIAANNTLRSYTGTATVRRKLTRDVNFAISYQNINQEQTPKQFGYLNGNHNRVYASLEYVWTHPLGR